MKTIHNILFLSTFILLLAVVPSVFAQSQQSLDSLSYEAQRERVNNLLNERSQRFGEYDQSLQKKTGIFGLFKTKGDMQKSIDILRTIVISDNNIFQETKKLIDLKDFEKERYQKLATEYDQQVSAYMKTITKLQQENDRLRQHVSELENTDNDILLYLAILLIVGLSTTLGIFVYHKAKQQKLTKL